MKWLKRKIFYLILVNLTSGADWKRDLNNLWNILHRRSDEKLKNVVLIGDVNGKIGVKQVIVDGKNEFLLKVKNF